MDVDRLPCAESEHLLFKWYHCFVAVCRIVACANNVSNMLNMLRTCESSHGYAWRVCECPNAGMSECPNAGMSGIAESNQIMLKNKISDPNEYKHEITMK